MKTTQSIIESILKANPCAITGREIYESMESQEKGFFPGGVDAVCKALGKLRDKGVVENGISEIVNGRTVLTWKLKNEKQKTSDLPGSSDMDSSQQANAMDDEKALEDEQIPDAAYEQLEAETVVTYDPFAELCQALHVAQDMLNRLKKPPVIANKPEKVTLLKFMQSFHGKLNEDVDRVLGEIISDLEKLEEAA